MIHEPWMICRFINLGLWVIYERYGNLITHDCEWSISDVWMICVGSRLWMICKVIDCRFNWWINQNQEL
jgi:hypothetical protein